VLAGSNRFFLRLAGIGHLLDGRHLISNTSASVSSGWFTGVREPTPPSLKISIPPGEGFPRAWIYPRCLPARGSLAESATADFQGRQADGDPSLSRRKSRGFPGGNAGGNFLRAAEGWQSVSSLAAFRSCADHSIAVSSRHVLLVSKDDDPPARLEGWVKRSDEQKVKYLWHTVVKQSTLTL